MARLLAAGCHAIPVLHNSTDHSPASGVNAFLDVWFQPGVIGPCAFVGLVTFTFVRSWLLASKHRSSVVHAWPALVLVVLTTTALVESSILVEFGWLTIVVC